LLGRRFFEDIALSISYESRNTLFSRLSIVSKTIFILSSSAVALLANSVVFLLLLLAVNMGIVLSARSMLGRIAMMLRGLAPFFVFIFVFNVVVSYILGGIDIVDVAVFQLKAILRIVSLLPPVLLFITTTTPLQIVELASRLGISYFRLYPLVVAYRFIPTVFHEMKSIYDAQRSRGLELEKGSIVGRVKSLASIVVPSIVCSTIRARDLAESLMLRGFGYSKNRTFYRPTRFTKLDALFISAIAAIHSAIVALAYLSPFQTPL